MARFISANPINFTEPRLSFVQQGDEFVFETDDEKLTERLRSVAAQFGLSESAPDDLETRTVEDLKGYATEYGVDLKGATLKADIVAAIRGHFDAIGAPVETPDLPADAPALIEAQPVPTVEDVHADVADPNVA